MTSRKTGPYRGPCEYCKKTFEVWARRRFCTATCRVRSFREIDFGVDMSSLFLSDAVRLTKEDRSYAITRTGIVYSAAASKPPLLWRKLKQYKESSGYMTVAIRGKTTGVHKLVAHAFLGNQKRGIQVRHLDGDPTNNDLSNLKYGTGKENADDMVAHGRSARGKKHHLNKLDEAEVFAIRRLLNGQVYTWRSIAEKFGVNKATIGDIASKRTWAWLL